jgi:hypothetical protein
MRTDLPLVHHFDWCNSTGKQQALDVGQSQRIIAMVCSPPPQGIRDAVCA